jgi:hypothetical protein
MESTEEEGLAFALHERRNQQRTDVRISLANSDAAQRKHGQPRERNSGCRALEQLNEQIMSKAGQGSLD